LGLGLMVNMVEVWVRVRARVGFAVCVGDCARVVVSRVGVVVRVGVRVIVGVGVKIGFGVRVGIVRRSDSYLFN